MSQDDLARTSGIQRKTVYQIEIGKTDPRLGTVCRIARALEVEPWELIRAVPAPAFQRRSMSRSADQQASHRALGRAVREVREAKSPRMSQETLGRIAGKDRAYIGAIERGERRPSYATLIALATGLGVPLWKLVKRAQSLERDEESTRWAEPARLG